MIKPAILSEGDTVGLISPGSYITDDEFNNSVRNLEMLGFNIKPGRFVKNRYGYFAGTDQERLTDLHTMFADENVKAVFCTRGGYGCTRLLPFIDYELIKNNPKVFIGYSDVTSLLLAINKMTGLVTFHGPVGISNFNHFTTEYFRKILMTIGNSETELISEPELKSENSSIPFTIVPGKAEGFLTGGNLSVFVSLIGTEYEPETENSILFFEETGEEPYRIDRMFTQLIQSGILSGAAGIALGTFKNCESREVNPSFMYSFSLIEVLKERLGIPDIPVVYGLSIGHIKNKLTLPVGMKVELDADKKRIFLPEPAVKIE
ncbi:MAG: LD-carboxypeptidase [Ignavibacteriaceae bacterium]